MPLGITLRKEGKHKGFAEKKFEPQIFSIKDSTNLAEV